MRLFVVQVKVDTTQGDAQYSVNKQTNYILNLTNSVYINDQLILASHRRWFLEENKSSFLLCFLFNHYFGWTIYCTHKKSPQKVSKWCPQKVSTKSVHKQCPQKVSTKSVHEKCQQEVSKWSVHKKCPQRVSKVFTKSVHKIVPKKCPQKVSIKSVHIVDSTKSAHIKCPKSVQKSVHK